KLVGWFDERKRLGALEVLQRYLFDSNEAPLKRALMKTGLVRDVSFVVNGYVLQPYASLTLRGTEAERRDTLLDALRAAVRELLADGPDPEDLNAAIDRMELSLRHLDEPQGLDRAELLVRSRLYGGDPLLYIENESVIKELRDAVGTDYYTSLVKEFFLDDTNTVEVVLRPDPEKGEKDRAREEALLNAVLDAMTPETLAAEKERFARFKAWQETPDAPEAKATLPTLTLADVERLPEKYPTEKKICGEREILFHPQNTNGINHLVMYFNVADQPVGDLSALSFVTELLGELPTESYNGALLQRASKRLFGSFWTTVVPVSAPETDDRTPVCFCAAFSALSAKLPEALSLAAEILLRTEFDDKERIRNILKQTRENMLRHLCNAGNYFAATRAMAAVSAEYALRDVTGGIGYYLWLKDFEDDFDARADAFLAFASGVAGRLFTLARLTVSETADEYRDDCFGGLSAFPAGEKCACEKMPVPSRGAEKEAFIIPGGVSYAAQCALLEALGVRPCGDMGVLANVLSLDYLWNEIRVRGGAYGCSCSLSEFSGLRLSSYRDPDPVRSLGVYADASSYIRAFCAGDESVDNYIISASAEPLLEPAVRGRVEDLRLLGGIPYEYRRRRREELLDTKKEDLAAYAPLFDRARECASFCVIGSRDAIGKLGDGWKVKEL
ncbi:MAG: insulinase family protein, partial [Clostridia bacterium]|nr:insulinase family protein [Clostridia bacterium]